MRGWVLIGVLSMWSWAAHAHLQVDAARNAYDEGNFDLALKLLADAEKDPSLTRTDLVQLQWWRAASLHARRQANEADAAFDALLELEPLYEPGVMDASPVLQAAYEKRATRWRKERGVSLGPPVLAGAQLRVEMREHPQEVAAAVAFIRAPGEATYAAHPLTVSDGVARGVVGEPALWERAALSGAVEVVVEVRNTRNAVVARAGNARAPVRLSVDAPQAREAAQMVEPERRLPWRRLMGVTAGAVLVGGGVLVALVGMAGLAVASGANAGLMWLGPWGAAPTSAEQQALRATWGVGAFGALVGLPLALAAGMLGAALLGAAMP